MNRNNSGFAAGFLLLALLAISALTAAQDLVTKALQDELARSAAQLQMQGMPKPYFVAYRADDIDETTVSASLGSITGEQPSHRRMLGVEVRVGDYKLDNSNFFSMRSFAGAGARFASSLTEAPLDDDYAEIRRRLWLATDGQYKTAVEDYSGKKAALEQRKQEEDAQDFAREPPAHVSETPAPSKVDLAALERLARTTSAVFKQTPEIYTSAVEIECRNVYTRYVNSEGTSFTRWQPYLHVNVSAETQSSDGLPISESFDVYGRSISELPREAELAERARQMGARLAKLREAGYLDRYNGPLLFEDEAAAEIFAQVFAPALVAVRAPVSDDPRFEMFFDQFASQFTGGSLLEKIGGRVLPEFLSVSENPQQESYKGAVLPGAWKIDDDGVMTRPVQLVEKGTLKTLLSTRTPAPPLAHSTGSRRGWGPAPTTLTLAAEKTMTHDEMRQELLRRVKERGLPYGIVVRTVGGGGMTGMLRMFAAMASSPGAMATNSLTEVYKLFPDGHEEAIRGADLSGMTTASFRDIVAAGDKPVLFNALFIPKFNALFSMGLSGATEMPVASYIVPSLLFEEATVVKTTGPRPNPPVTGPPLMQP
ncbi:MAG: metallopeptidase TldD-related protein [Candidatus Sulfotelmatobacter sp.]